MESSIAPRLQRPNQFSKAADHLFLKLVAFFTGLRFGDTSFESI